MGCGLSKFNKGVMGHGYLYCNPLHRAVSAGHWRHKPGHTASANPTKQLLVEGAADSGHSSGGNHGRKSVSHTPSSALEEKAAMDDPSHSAPANESITKQPSEPQQMKKAIAISAAGDEDARGCSKPPSISYNKEKSDKEENDDCKMKTLPDDDREDSIIYLGSPSFRVYCRSSNNADSRRTNDAVAVLGDHMAAEDDDGDGRESTADALQTDSSTCESEKEGKPSSEVVDSDKVLKEIEELTRVKKMMEEARIPF
ncbi:hypothetical protein SAY87_025697 [Trapa incisa]|uniref:Uncharacterized protein n=1 Tax=Trapa incisa TaxID=236973 RepID=A0AAN7GID9_9MYRT|nr:hypothetical protein SAY87_025697 [Trapa incisa]